MGKRLNELLPGEEAVILKIDKASQYRKRLMEMGFRKGGIVLMKRDAPMGDPMEIHLMGYNVSLRRSEASHIIIDRIKKTA